VQIHSAKLDMLAVVSAIFSKRDQEDILGLKKTVKKILQENNVGPKSFTNICKPKGIRRYWHSPLGTLPGMTTFTTLGYVFLLLSPDCGTMQAVYVISVNTEAVVFL